MTTNDPTSLDLAALSMLSLVFDKKSFSAAAEREVVLDFRPVCSLVKMDQGFI